LVLAYCRHHKLDRLDVREAATMPLFNNKALGRESKSREGEAASALKR